MIEAFANLFLAWVLLPTATLEYAWHRHPERIAAGAGTFLLLFGITFALRDSSTLRMASFLLPFRHIYQWFSRWLKDAKLFEAQQSVIRQARALQDQALEIHSAEGEDNGR